MKLKCSVDRVVQTIDSCIYIYLVVAKEMFGRGAIAKRH